MKTIKSWASDAVYQPDSIVVHKGVTYQKVDDGDNTEPDAVDGGWRAMEDNNAAEFNAIAASFDSYEERVRQHKAEILVKLQAAGLDPDDVKAVLAAD